jgi:hypothetical protein
MTVPRCRAEGRSSEWCRAGRIVGLVLVLLATGLPVGHSHLIHEPSVYDPYCPDARLAMGAPAASLPERSDGAVALVPQPTGIWSLPAETAFRPRSLPTWRAPPA